MTEIFVTESLEGLSVPFFTHDTLLRNDRGQVIERKFFRHSDFSGISPEDQEGLVAVLRQEFDGAGLLLSRFLDVTNVDTRLAARVRAELRGGRDPGRWTEQ